MGYRNYIGSLSRKEYNKIKSLTKEELLKYKNAHTDDDDEYICVFDLPEKKLHEFGKYCEFGDKKFYKNFFENEELNEEYQEDDELYIVEKDFLKHVIEFYTEKVKNIYLELIKGVDNTESITLEKAGELFKHIKGQSMEWNQLTPYNLESGEEITKSWKYEYNVFELVRIYKSFDWEKNVMIYYGY